MNRKEWPHRNPREGAVALTYNVLRTVKTNKSRNRKYPKVSFVIPCLKIQVERLLWSRFFSHSKNHGRLSACMTCEDGKEPFPCFVFRMFTAGERWRPRERGRGSGFASHNSTTNPLTAAALIYAFGAGITAGAGTRLVLQLILDFGWH